MAEPAADPAAEPAAEPAAAEDEGGTGLAPNAGNGADHVAYSWTQTLAEVTVAVPLPAGTRGKDCDVSIARDALRVGLRGAGAPVLDGPLFGAVRPDDCAWSIADAPGGGRLLEATLAKADAMQWWRCVVKGEPEINTQKVEPEASKLSDLDGDTRATVEKMMWDQRQKALGRPTSEEEARSAALKSFMAAHPEMDFSGAEMSI
jgi:hypothetical protein